MTLDVRLNVSYHQHPLQQASPDLHPTVRSWNIRNSPGDSMWREVVNHALAMEESINFCYLIKNLLTLKHTD